MSGIREPSVPSIAPRVGELVALGLSANEARVYARVEAGDAVGELAKEQGVSQQSVSDALRRAKIKVASAHPKVMLRDRSMDFEAAVMLMDDDLREEVHGEIAPCTEQEFMDKYVRRHREKFGQEFTI